MFNHNENNWANVLFFMLYVRLLHDVGYIIGCRAFGFHVPECHVSHSQVGALRCDVCMAKVDLEHGFIVLFQSLGFMSRPCVTQTFVVWYNLTDLW